MNCKRSAAPHMRTIRLPGIANYSLSACLYASGALINVYDSGLCQHFAISCERVQ